MIRLPGVRALVFDPLFILKDEHGIAFGIRVSGSEYITSVLVALGRFSPLAIVIMNAWRTVE